MQFLDTFYCSVMHKSRSSVGCWSLQILSCLPRNASFVFEEASFSVDSKLES